MTTGAADSKVERFVLPASYAQQRLWFLDRLEGRGAAYNVPVATRLRGRLDVAALESALGALVDRHETLRTVFTEVDGVAKQIVVSEWPLSLPVKDLRGAPDAEQRGYALARESASQPFDLTRDRLLRALLVRFGDEDHILVLTIHHIVADAWSVGVLNRELSTLYAAAVAGTEPDLPELEIQYGDFAAWQQDWMEAGGLDAQLAYWKDHLAGASGVLELPTDHPRPAEQSFRGETIRTVLPPELLQRLKALSEREGATLFMTLLATFTALLGRYSGQDDILVATPVANRGRVEFEGVIGLFVNTLVMRGDLSGEPTYRELLERMRGEALGAFSNQDLPFEKLVQELSPERDRSRPPIAQVLFALAGGDGHGSGLVGLEHERVVADRGTSKFDISLFAGEVRDGLRIAIEYCTDLFERSTIERMLEHYRVLLESAVAQPDARVHELEILTDAERKQLLTDWNATDVALPESLVHELFAAQAARTPDRIALRFGDERLTYGELDRRSNQVAHHLRSRGVGPDVPVGICVERSLEMIVGLLGVLKAGGAYVPIDPGYPADRQEYMLANSEAPVVLTQDRIAPRIKPGDATIVSLDGDWEVISALPISAPSVRPRLDDLSYLIYTSGSTGKPKGVQLTHAGLLNVLCSMRDGPALGAEDVLLAITTLSFDIASLELLLPLIGGAQVAIAPGDAIGDPDALIALLERTEATAMQATPTTWRMLVDAGWSGRPGLKAITGGEALKVELADELIARGLELWNAYAPSETTIYSTRALIAGLHERITIGRPLANTKLYILDEYGHPVPIGVPGELWIGGTGVARGYRGRPDLTAERFLPDPFSEKPGRMYRTGDLTRYLADGRVEYLGRIDHQVKVRGFRIEPGEIEAALREHPAVGEALVVAREAGGETRLVGYVVVEGPAPTPAELRERLSRVLPEYMIPSAFVALDAFPVTPNGKVDRRALPSPDADAIAAAEYVEPDGELEQGLAAIWAELLAVPRVGAQDNFFVLGGHSLLAVRLISRIRARLGIGLPLRAIFDHPTLRELAAAAEAARPAQDAVRSSIPRAPREESSALPASYAEQRLWFLERLDPGNTAYNLAQAVRVRGPLDLAALEAALTGLVHRHETLRTTFPLVDGLPRREIAPPYAVRAAVIDLSEAEDRESEAQAQVDTVAGAPFDLERGPLFRVGAIRLAGEDHILVLALHHIIVDGWSLGVLGRELSELYGAAVSGRRPSLPELPIQYADFAHWQHGLMEEGGLEGQLEYWRSQLAGAPALLELPTDRPRPPRQSYRGAVVRRVIPREILSDLKHLGEREGATLFMTLLAAFATLLGRYSGQDDIVVASPVAGRDRVELEGLIGLFVNTLALRADLSDDPSFLTLLARVRETALEAFANQAVPFERLVEELNPVRQRSYPPLAQVSFALATDEGGFELPALETSRVGGSRRTAKFDLGLSAVDAPEGLRVSMEYVTDLFDEATIERFLSHFENLLRGAVADPDRPVSELRLLSASERNAALQSLSSGGVEYPVACMHEHFERWATEKPDAPAVTFAGETRTYGELNTAANRLAHRLRELGAGRETMVALALEPSFELVTAVLGVLKAGAAYVPLDPGYPPERLRFVLADTAAPIVVTTETLLGRLPHHNAQTVCVDRGGELADQSTANPESLARPENLAYVIYTSGSTGQPKGVQIEHRQIARLFSATDEWYSFTPADTWMLLHSYAFDFSVWELWGALAYGGRLVVSPRATTRAPAELAELVAAEGVTVLNATPSLFLAVQAELLSRSSRLSLRTVIFGGEALQPAALRPWFAHYGEDGPTLVNMYGITETTVHVTYRPVRASDCESAVSPIGVPIPDLSLYVLDRHGEPVPRGVTGELYVGGAGVARGYLNRPELTAERFVESPFGDGRLYRTGDLARHLGSGELDFRGRGDDQVKIRGFRIELGEIRSALLDHPGVGKAAVVPWQDESGDKRLAAYVVAAASSESPGADELRRFLSDRLPPHMVPSGWVFLDVLPLTRNGKLDVAALPDPDYDRSAAAARYVAPATATERALAGIWARVLGVPEVGVNDDFFALGGHSLLAVRLFAEIERELGARLPISALFETATVAGLAELIDRERISTTEWSSLVPLRSGNGAAPLYLVAWAGGEVLPYRDLVESLDADVSVFGLRAPGVDRRTPPLASVEELARYYVGEVRKHQPRGPYRLGGFCFSGLVAYEMARLLMDEGEEIDLLAMLDAYPYRKPERRRRIQVEARLADFKRADAQGRREWAKERVRAQRIRFTNAVYVKYGPRAYAALRERNRQHWFPRRPWNAVLVASNLARLQYVPRPLDVHVEFFRAQQTPHSRPTVWDELALRGVTLRQIVAPGINHERMMREPYVKLLTAELRQALLDD